MPAPIAHAGKSDEWQQLALRLARIVRAGPGSDHARVETVKASLVQVAEENYKAGEAAGKQAEEERQRTELTGWTNAATALQNAVLPLIPEEHHNGSASDIAAALTAEVKRLHREIAAKDERIHALEQDLAVLRGKAVDPADPISGTGA